MAGQTATGGIRVLIAEDHPLFRVALVEALSGDPEFDIVAVADDGVAALRRAREMRPDVVLLDVHMPGLNGPDVARKLVEVDPGARVLFISGSTSRAVVTECFAAGGLGYVVKDAGRDEIKEAIKRVAAGDRVRPVLPAQEDAPPPLLTERELAVLRQVSRGLSVAQIAALMFLSPATIKSHLQAIYMKLGVNERAAAVGEAMRRDLLA